MPGYIHHIQWCVGNLGRTRKMLEEKYQFKVLSRRDDSNGEEIVLRSGQITFLVSQRADREVITRNSSEPVYPWLSCSCREHQRHERDSVFNIALEVCDVDSTAERMRVNGGKVLHTPKTLVTPEGSVRFAVISSPCNNVIHSIVNTRSFTGSFLPGFHDAEEADFDNDDQEEALLSDIDHVTLVVNEGETAPILDWYAKSCGMQRFQVAPDEDPEEGAVFEAAGMKLTAADWLTEWMCREDGVVWESADSGKAGFKLVIAEPLSNREDSHIHRYE